MAGLWDDKQRHDNDDTTDTQSLTIHTTQGQGKAGRRQRGDSPALVLPHLEP